MRRVSGLLSLCWVACTAAERAEPPPKDATVARAPARVQPPLAAEPRPAPEPEGPPDPPSAGAFRLVALPVPDFLDAVVAVPEGDAPVAVVVATHGAGGDPEWTCNEWGARVRGRALVLCPRGKAISLRYPSGFYYPEHFSLEKEVLASLAAVSQAFSKRIAGGPLLYTGYSQGATMGALFLTAHAERFPSLVLTEGGFASWTRGNAKRYAAGGGKRVLFVCGGKGCRDRAEKSAAILKDAGVATRVEYVPGGGHTDGGSVGQRLDETYEWALER